MDTGLGEYTIPAMSAADWLAVLMVSQLAAQDVFPGMLGDPAEQEEIRRQLRSGELDVFEIEDLALETISTVCGRPWWVALRLVYTAQSSWDALGGEMARRADPQRLSIAAWLDVLFLLVVQNIDNEKRTMFLMKLELAPEGWGEQTEPEMSPESFLAMAG